MFEKEAEETFRKNYTEYCCGKELLSPYWDLWQDGAEFGYNKASEWHYPSKGELPKTEQEVLVYMWGSFYIGYYEQNTDKNNRWHFEDFNEESEQVTAWKEIVLPKE